MDLERTGLFLKKPKNRGQFFDYVNLVTRYTLRD